MGKGIGGHTRAHHGATDDWITPPHIVRSLGRFDLDPCACIPQPWPCAERSYDLDDDGLAQPWNGRVWLNPPYGPRAEPFLAKLAEHSDGVALLFARTETELFHRYIWNAADALLFLKGRLYFHRPDGTRAPGNAGGPSVLIAYGHQNVSSLRDSGLDGAFVEPSRPNRTANASDRKTNVACAREPTTQGLKERLQEAVVAPKTRRHGPTIETIGKPNGCCRRKQKPPPGFAHR